MYFFVDVDYIYTHTQITCILTRIHEDVYRFVNLHGKVSYTYNRRLLYMYTHYVGSLRATHSLWEYSKKNIYHPWIEWIIRPLTLMNDLTLHFHEERERERESLFLLHIQMDGCHSRRHLFLKKERERDPECFDYTIVQTCNVGLHSRKRLLQCIYERLTSFISECSNKLHIWTFVCIYVYVRICIYVYIKHIYIYI